ncbi:MAG: deoxyribose-phosphate aldolase [Nitrospirota bacterium]|nr:deoxyribose-phosphate aldolase [Nitrospirota bacterium]
MPEGHETVASLIDHTLLKADATPAQVETLCIEAMRYGFYTVCVNPCYVELACAALRGSAVKVCTVIGFPLGASTTVIKLREAANAVRNGAVELDMVMNIGLLKAGDYRAVEVEVALMAREVPEALHKAIIETCYLTDKEKRAAAQMVVNAGAQFVKTSTGFGPGGATVEDVKLLAEEVAGRAQVKASGGIKDLATLRAMVAAGAARIGTSSGVKIVGEFGS